MRGLIPLLAEMRQLIVHLPPSAVLIAERTVLRQAMPGVE
jgi:hypothetical protein